MKDLSFISVQDAINMHDLLSNNVELLNIMDPVEPRGVKSINMLESAISKQQAGFGDYFHYDNVYKNCAAVLYGIINNHPFNNGNKRTAFLCMLKHLFNNGYVLKCDVSQTEIYNFLIAIASNRLKQHAATQCPKFYKQYAKINWDDDLNILYIAHWIRRSAISKQRQIKYELTDNELVKILNNAELDAKFEGHILKVSNRVSLVDKFLGKSKKTCEYGRNAKKNRVSREIVHKIRKDFNLTSENGFDDVNFYNPETFFDQELLTYKSLIYKLSKN